MSDLRSIHILLVDTDPESIAAIAFFASEIKNCVLDVTVSKSEALQYVATVKKPDLIIFAHDSELTNEHLFTQITTQNREAYSIVILPEIKLELGKEYRERGARDGVYRLENYLGNMRHAIRKALGRLRGTEADIPLFEQIFDSGKSILHYNILELVGSGIRTDVYKAHDLKEDRIVAMKILPPSIANHPVILRRLARESIAASNLKHPSFTKVFAVEDAHGIALVVMEHLEGDSLAKLLTKGSIGMFRLLDIGSQLSEALDISHREGIIHGNLKPGNIFLTPYGTAKLLDFGLPQRIPSSVPLGGLEGLLKISCGGLPWDSLFYLSPEQTRGEDLDARSDVFSLGSVLYEAATGERPFEANDPSSILNKIQNEEPKRPSHFKPHLQGEFDNILLQALEKDRAKRGASASSLHRVLSSLKSQYIPEAIEETTEEPDKVSEEQTPQKTRTTALIAALTVVIVVLAGIFFWLLPHEKQLIALAVLPPQYPKTNEAMASISTAFMDGLIEELSAVPQLQVVQPFTSFYYLNSADPESSGKLLNVRYILSGKLQGKDQDWNFTVQLKDLKTNGVRWQEKYPVQIEKFSTIRSGLAHQVLESLDLTLNQQQEKFFKSKLTKNIPALQMYFQGRYLYYKHSPDDLEQSIRLYDLAIANDRQFATAYAAQALSYLDLAKFGSDETNSFEKAAVSAIKALHLQERQSEAHMVLGAVHLLYKWDFKTAEAELKRAVDLNPNSSRAHSYLAYLYTARQQPKAALEEMMAAQKRDPASEMLQLEFIQLLTKLKKYDEAIQFTHTNMDTIDPIPANLLLGDAYLGKQEREDALLAYQRCKDLGSNDATAKIATVLADTGMTREAVTLLENLIYRSSAKVNPDFIAAAYARIGDRKKALEWLQKSSRNRPSSLILIRVDPFFDALRNDPPFEQFLLKAGL